MGGHLTKIGFYGGTFDPIHFGHINLALSILEYHDLDEVWFCPAFQSPFKRNPSIASSKDRLKMCHLALKGIPCIRLIDDEIKLGHPTATIETVRHLIAKHGDKQFFLLIGDDQLPSIHLWTEIDELIQLAPPLVARRLRHLPFCNGSKELQSAIQRGMTNSSLMQIEATELRERLKKRLYCGHLVPSKTLDYILQHQLYLSIHEPRSI